MSTLLKNPIISELSKTELTPLKVLLDKNSLPTEDLDSAIGNYWGIKEHNELIAGVGLEAYGTVGLLRSLVVDAKYRTAGIGLKLVNHVIAEGGRQRLSDIYLLTTTAVEFFKRSGWRPIFRESVPEDIKKSTEYAYLCPSTAVNMKFELV